LSVAARMTIAEPGTPCAPLGVIREIPSTRIRCRTTAASRREGAKSQCFR
jgi:hypothetical protein